MEWMEKRIDRALVLQSWLDVFALAKLHNLEDSSTSSDHNPLLLEPNPAMHRFV